MRTLFGVLSIIQKYPFTTSWINFKLQRGDRAQSNQRHTCWIHFVMTMKMRRLCSHGHPWHLGLLVLLVVFLRLVPTQAKEDRVPTCSELNKNFDDDTVICNQASPTDYSYDLTKLDPNRAPLRCEDWTIEDVNLNIMDELYICEKWHELYGRLRPTPAPTRMPTASPTRTPTSSPTTSPTKAPTRGTPPPIDEDHDGTANQGDDTTSPSLTETVRLNSFSLRIVVPTVINRLRRALQNGVPYDQEEFLTVTSNHISQYLENELNREVAAVNLRSDASQVTSLQGSTVVKETISGSVDFVATANVASPKTVNALAVQSLEGQEMWEYFFQLRGANDPYLQKTQQVTLVDSTPTSTENDSSSGGSTFSTGVIATLVVIGIITAAIVGYFIVWLKKQHRLDRERQESKKQKSEAAETPDTQASDGATFFADTPPETRNNRSFRKQHKHAQQREQEEMSVSNLSFVSSVNSALHSIRERSLEDEEEEPEEDSSNWGEDTASEIDVQTGLVENMPPLNYSNGDEVTIVTEADYGQIRRIMPLETSYSTSNGTEVTRRNLEVTSQPITKKPAEKPANRWHMWKKKTGRQQKKNAAAKQFQAVAQKKKPPVPPPPPPPPTRELNTSLEPPSMVDMSLDPPSQEVELSALETSLDPPSQIINDEEAPSFQSSEASLDGESIQLSEF